MGYLVKVLDCELVALTRDTQLHLVEVGLDHVRVTLIWIERLLDAVMRDRDERHVRQFFGPAALRPGEPVHPDRDDQRDREPSRRASWIRRSHRSFSPNHQEATTASCEPRSSVVRRRRLPCRSFHTEIRSEGRPPSDVPSKGPSSTAQSSSAQGSSRLRFNNALHCPASLGHFAATASKATRISSKVVNG